jgi:hypothetical protein
MLILLASIALATPCNDGWESSSSGSGTCSHHGGVSYGGHVPTTYVPTTYTLTSGDRSSLSFTDGVNRSGTHRWHSVDSGDFQSIRYSCHVDGDHNIGESILFALPGSWSPEDTKITNLSVNIVANNKIIPIKYWFVEYNADSVVILKSTFGLTQGDGLEIDPMPLSSLQVSQVINSDLIFIGEGSSIRITVPNSFASAARKTWMKCNQ